MAENRLIPQGLWREENALVSALFSYPNNFDSISDDGPGGQLTFTHANWRAPQWIQVAFLLKSSLVLSSIRNSCVRVRLLSGNEMQNEDSAIVIARIQNQLRTELLRDKTTFRQYKILRFWAFTLHSWW